MPRRVSVIYFHKPESSALSGAVLAVVHEIEGVLRGAIRSALAGGLARIDVEMKREIFPEAVAGQNVNATPEALINEALQSAQKKLADEGLEVEAEEKRVSNRTRSAKIKLRVRRRR
jgi:hypothetical protein